jgi:hypothetical protein
MIGFDKNLTLSHIFNAMRFIVSGLLVMAFAACLLSSCRAKKVDCPAYGQKAVEKSQRTI